MPDVIIKGMEMPESCYCCRANNGVYCFAVPDDADDVVGPYYRARSGKPDWCPLRPAPEVVRCRECVNWRTDWEPEHSSQYGRHLCVTLDLVTEGDWFCSDGERKKEVPPHD